MATITLSPIRFVKDPNAEFPMGAETVETHIGDHLVLDRAEFFDAKIIFTGESPIGASELPAGRFAEVLGPHGKFPIKCQIQRTKTSEFEDWTPASQGKGGDVEVIPPP